MTEVLKNIFKDDTFGPKITLFGFWHLLILILIIGASFAISILLRKKSKETKSKIVDISVIVLIALYFGDFFVHPFMTGEDKLIVDKLPFHLCTGACILIALTRIFPNKLRFMRTASIILGMIGGLMYLTVPTALDGEYLLCYRSLQTICYHGLLMWIGISALVFEDIVPSFKTIYVEAIILALMDIISIGANYAYGGIQGVGETYNWFFSMGLFGLDKSIMPFVMFAVLMAMVAIMYLICFVVKKIVKNKKNA